MKSKMYRNLLLGAAVAVVCSSTGCGKTQVELSEKEPVATEAVSDTTTDKPEETVSEEAAGKAGTEESDSAGKRAQDADFLKFESRKLPKWSQDNYPRTMYVTFKGMSDEKKAETMEQLKKSENCEKAATVLVNSRGLTYLRAEKEHINPDYVDWVKNVYNVKTESKNTDVLGKEIPIVPVETVYTEEGCDETVLFETTVPVDGNNTEQFRGDFVVNYTKGDVVNFGSKKEVEASVKLDKVTTEADWMYDLAGFGVYVKLSEDEFDRIVKSYGKHYYIKAKEGKQEEMRKEIIEAGGYTYIDVHYE